MVFTARVVDCCRRFLAYFVVENPKGSLLWTQPDWIEYFGAIGSAGAWKHYEPDGCQLGSIYHGDDDKGAPCRKSQIWLANFDLSGLELRCRRPNALAGCSHEHRRIRGRMLVNGESFSVAEYSGKYNPELATVYSKEVQRVCNALERQEYKGKQTQLQALA